MKIKLITAVLLAVTLNCTASAGKNGFRYQDNTLHHTTRVYLEEAIKKSLSHSPEITTASADKDAAHYDIEQVKGQRWPQVQLGTTAPVASFGGGNHAGQRHLSDSNLAINVSTTVFDWGKNHESIQSATQSANASRYQYDYTKQQIAYNTVLELIDLSRYKQSQNITQQYVERMRELVNMLVKITQIDAGRYSELVQARARLLAAEATMQRVTEQLRQSEIKLSRLTGTTVTMPENIDWRMDFIPSSLVMSRLTEHPELLRAKAEANAAEHQSAAIKASSLPQINWVVSKNTAKDSYGNDEQWYTGLNIQWNVFSGGSEKATIQAASARAVASKSQSAQTRMDMEYQIHNLIQSRDSAQTQTREYKKLSKETDAVSKIYYEQWLHLGKRTLLDVLTAENDRYNNQIAAVTTEHDVYSANVKLIATAGMIFEWLPVNNR
jgi:adhesin transport system outer membrane protein